MGVMARPLRIDVEGGWYHVMSRGIERRTIFLDDSYCLHFLDLLGEMSERFIVEVLTVGDPLDPQRLHALESGKNLGAGIGFCREEGGGSGIGSSRPRKSSGTAESASDVSLVIVQGIWKLHGRPGLVEDGRIAEKVRRRGGLSKIYSATRDAWAGSMHFGKVDGQSRRGQPGIPRSGESPGADDIAGAAGSRICSGANFFRANRECRGKGQGGAMGGVSRALWRLGFGDGAIAWRGCTAD